MANTVKLKRSAVASKVPLTTDLELGELAMNTYDGKLFLKKDDGAESIVEIGAGGGGSSQLAGPFTLGVSQSTNITLDTPIENPQTSVQLEVPLANQSATVTGAEANFSVEDFAYAADITFSNTTGYTETVTLSSGTWSASDVGRTIKAGTGNAFITAQDGSAVASVTINAEVPSSVTSGNWSLVEAVSSNTTLKLSNGTQGESAGFEGFTSEVGRYGFNIPSAVLDTSYAVGAGNQFGISFKPDGTRMYVLNLSTAAITQYDLTYAWTLNFTPTAAGTTVVSNWGATSPEDMFISPDGLTLYVTSNGTDAVYQTPLTTAWDISTAQAGSTVSYSTLSQESGMTGLCFSNDGVYMYLTGDTSNVVYQYELSTPWLVTSASYINFMSTNDTTPEAVAISSDGRWVATVGNGSDVVRRHWLREPFMVASGVLVDSFSVATEELTPSALYISPDGFRMAIAGPTSDTVFLYEMDHPAVLEPTRTTFSTAGQSANPRAFRFNDNGTKGYLLDITSGIVYEYTLSVPYGIHTLTYTGNSFDVVTATSTSGAYTSLFFNKDGSSFYFGGQDFLIYQIDLATPWDITTASFNSKAKSHVADTGSFAARENLFSPDGVYMYLQVDTGTVELVCQYTLSTPWDVSTATFTNSKDITYSEANPQWMYINDTGTQLWSGGSQSTRFNIYTLVTPWDITTAVRVPITPGTLIFDVASSQAIGDMSSIEFVDDMMYGVNFNNDLIEEIRYNKKMFTEDIGVYGSPETMSSIAFSSDGTKMYGYNSSTELIYQFSLGIPFTASSIVYDNKTFSTATETTVGISIALSSDGTKLYLLDSSPNIVRQYNMSTPYDIDTMSYSGVSLDLDTLTSVSTTYDIVWKPDGSKFIFLTNTLDAFIEVNCSTPWDLTTATLGNSYTSPCINPIKLAISPDGTTAVSYDNTTPGFMSYKLSTPWDISTISSETVFMIDGTPIVFGVAHLSFGVDGNGTEKFFVGYSGGINGFDIPSTFATSHLTGKYVPVVTSSTGQLNTTTWTDINSTTINTLTNSSEIYTALSTDGGNTFVVKDLSAVERPIVRLNVGTWEYNSNATFGSTTWTTATANTVYQAAIDAMSVAANQMPSSVFDAIADIDQLTLGSTLDALVIMKSTDTTKSPSYFSIDYNYDSTPSWQTAVPGTDYTLVQSPDTTTMTLSSLTANTYKVRIG